MFLRKSGKLFLIKIQKKKIVIIIQKFICLIKIVPKILFCK